MTAQVFTGEQIDMFQAITIRSAIKLYVNTGMKANRAYTPKNMVATVERMLGTTFKGNSRAKMIAAYNALSEKIGDGKRL